MFLQELSKQAQSLRHGFLTPSMEVPQLELQPIFSADAILA
ncbi:hypothetical protein HMPREF9296_0223 [Prevotella disiens FB035-09AN]|uniref:Uncharacterized protein n=1 Tax=Prevotella disiens FB035-09AN TaxID=866771 RepID=E1KT30_9BACT|nr:hypothetical protein HMPREF9296_0223 [Prevotella disiens FB035-09AN]